MTEKLSFIAKTLPDWYSDSFRPLPWRKNADPYKVWLSEIMLQQTRVETVIEYYNRFLSVLPDIPALAVVSEEVLLKLWEGLGYYNRARNLQKAAKIILEKYKGQFPRTYEEILSLPGIGEYTAGAIGSICFDLPTPAVDGNVLRVYTRFFEDSGIIDLQQTKKAVRDALIPLYRIENPGIITQSLMELGACICVPNGSPKCEICPLSCQCSSFAHHSWDEYPKRGEKKKRRIVYKTILVLKCEDCFAIRKRDSTGMLANLWEFPNADLSESVQNELKKQNEDAPPDSAAAIKLADSFGVAPTEILKMLRYTHVFTHVEWHMTAWFLICRRKTDEFLWVSEEELKEKYAFPSAFRPFLQEVFSEKTE